MFEHFFHSIADNRWLYAPAGAVFLFAGMLHLLLRRRATGARRRALLFGVGVAAMLATGVFAVFGFSFIMLVTRETTSLEVVWIAGAVAAASLVVWLWFSFFRILRQP